MSKKIYTSEFTGPKIDQILKTANEEPVTWYYDENNALYRMFANEENRDLWLSDTELYADLELFNFSAPTPYTATFTGLSEDTKYIRYGDDVNTVLSYYWNISGKNQDNFVDTVTITYTFENNGTQVIPMNYTHAQQNVTFNMADYLKVGTNIVTVDLLGNTTNATNKIMFNVEVLDLSLTSDFKIYEPIIFTDSIINVPYELVGSPSYTRIVEFYIDGTRAATERITSTNNEYTATLQIINEWGNNPGLHTLQIIAYITIGGVNYYSNLLYLNFVISGFNTTDKKFIMARESFDSQSTVYASGETLKLTATQFEDFELEWGFYTSDPYNTSKAVVWQLEPTDLAYEKITVITAKQGTKPSNLIFTPTIYGQCYLCAYIDDEKIASYNLYIYLNANNISEASGHIFKLSAKSRSNDEPYSATDKSSSYRDKWEYTYSNALGSTTYTTDFHNVLWNSNSGWDGSSLILSNGASADVNINVLGLSTVGRLATNDTNGFTFEIEFETYNVGDKDETIIWVGDKDVASIQITPNSAFMTNTTGKSRIKTNFREGEKVRLAFILNSSASLTDAHHLYIVNNGILERGVDVPGETFNADGVLHINGTNTGIKVYSMKLYSRGISYSEAFYNYVIDSGDINNLLDKNNVYDSMGNISESLCEQKIDVVTIEGPLTSIITAKDKTAECSCTIKRICLKDKTKSFTITNGRIRRHGQSSLDYPVPNFKIWSNKEAKQASTGDPVMTDYKGAVIYKGRYAPKDGGIPCKKWVLQANYADSSGVHNGGLLRLINDTWYTALIESDYKLRTPPQQYTTSTGSYKNAGYKEDMGTSFPYKLRIAPDSFPCVLFWRESDTDDWTFLGQYVFMDDKKANDLYGESSIYNLKNDPFRLSGSAPKKEELERLWDNSKVLRLEILSVNTPFANYTTMSNTKGDWDTILADLSSDNHRSWKFNWENDFEVVYPEIDDLYNYGEDNQKNMNDSSIVSTRLQPFKDLMTWLVETYEDYKSTGTYDKFLAEASEHLDLYKLAAYYIFVLRFGLVDSLQRNAQIKTYDGQIWWYEPWDMDIALGNKNTGGIAFDPPIDRDTQDPDNPGTYWISGRNGIESEGTYTSCWLWDALEAWTTTTGENGEITSIGWIDNLVPTVAEALYGAGLTYDKVMDMFDDEYQDKWCEREYNDSGHYKYVENGNGNYLQYLQGARTSHRHYWTKASFDYWDAKWAVGEFRKNRVTLITNTTTTGQKIYITPTTNTYFSFYNGTTGSIEISSPLTTKGVETYFEMNQVLSTKDPRSIFGSLYISKLNLSEIAQYLERLNLGGLYSETTGSNIAELNIGMPWNDMLQGKGLFNYKNVVISDYENLNRLETLYVRGYRNISSFNTIISYLTNLKNFYAAGSGLTVFENCQSIGNQFNQLEFPDSLQSMTMYNALWQDMKFYHTVVGETHTREVTDSEGNTIIETYTDDTYLDPNALTEIPDTLKSVTFTGNTSQNNCSCVFVKKWIEDLTARSTDEYDAFADKSISLENINWYEDDDRVSLTYDELMSIAKFGTWSIKGYVKISLVKDPETGASIQPTSAELSAIRSTFGDYVFSLGSSDLTVDYEDNIIVISAPAPAYSDADDNLYLQEGNEVTLQASVFTLRATKRVQQWGIAPIGTSDYSDYTSGITIDLNTGVLTVPETLYDARTIIIACQDSTDADNSRIATINLHITKRTYPTTIGIKGIDLKYADGVYSIGSTSETYKFQIETYDEDNNVADFSGTISKYEWSYTNDNEHISLASGLDTSEMSLKFSDLALKMEYETLTVTITYANKLKYTGTTLIGMLRRTQVLSESIFSNVPLYHTVDMYKKDGVLAYPHSGTTYYSDDLSTLLGTFDLSEYNEDNLSDTESYDYYKNNVSHLRTSNTLSGYNLLLYLTHVTGVNISNFPKLQSLYFKDVRYDTSTSPYTLIGDDTWRATWIKNITAKNNDLITNYDFTPVTNLETVDISENDALVNADFTGLLNLTTVNAEDTTSNLTFSNNPNLTIVKYGTPTEIVIPAGTQVENDTLSILNRNNVTKLDLLLNTTSWNTFLNNYCVPLWMSNVVKMYGIPLVNLMLAYSMLPEMKHSLNIGTGKKCRLKSDGKSYIVTNVMPSKTLTTLMTLNVATPSTSYNHRSLFGIYNYSSSWIQDTYFLKFNKLSSSSHLICCAMSPYTGSAALHQEISFPLNTDVPISITPTKFIINGMNSKTYSLSNEFAKKYSLVLFGARKYSDSSITATDCVTSMIRCIFKEGDTTTAFFVPSKQDGAYGMFDLVEGKFYSNQGTGSFSLEVIDD